MSNKADLLKSINDAASQIGSRETGTKSKRDLDRMRAEDAKRHAAMVLRNANNMSGLGKAALAQLDGKRFDYDKTLLSAAKKAQMLSSEEEGRSVRSEYDYGSKRKFVDVLGNIKRDGLAGLKKGAVDFENPSQRSQKSRLTAASIKSLASSYKRQMAALERETRGLGPAADAMKKPIRF